MQKLVEYSQAIKTKYPEQVVFVVSKDKNGVANPMTIGWTMITSGSPAMMAVAIAPKRYTAECIRDSKSFTVVFPAEDQAETALFFGTKSGRDIDKLKATNTPHEPAKEIDSVILSDAVANFECTLEQEMTTGDHIVFIGKVVCSHQNTEDKQRLYSLETGGRMGGVKID